jgi:hypothetical protein
MRMSAAQLGDNLAQLVWESFTDFMERRTFTAVQLDDGEEGEDGGVATAAVEPEEALIFFMWLHTRAWQQASLARPEQLRLVLDAMHQALYEDLEARAIPRLQLPLFEQRVSVRYSEYYDAAANVTDEKVVEVAARRVLGAEAGSPTVILDLAEAATATSGPLRDFLQDIELEED